jgi:hypothetical protein
MIIIYPNNITAMDVDNENIAFPIANILSPYVKDVFRSSAATASIDLTVSSGDTVAVFGTNASLVEINKDGPLTVEYSSALGIAWATYTQDLTEHTVTVDLTVGSGYAEAGVIVVGIARTFVDPRYGLTEGTKDTSILKELQSGSFYVKKRNMLRTFDMQLELRRDNDFYSFIRDLYRVNGANPIAFRLNSTLTNLDWCVFGGITEPPSGNHEYFSHTTVAVKITESL